MMGRHLVPPLAPIDPESPRGRDVAAQLGEVLADVRDAIAAREAADAQATERPSRKPA